MKRRRNFKSIIFIILWVLLSAGVGYGYFYFRDKFISTSKYEIQSKFPVDSYNVSLSIMDSNKVDVTETIIVNTYGEDVIESDFTKTFPLWQVNYDTEGKLQHNRVSIKSLRSDEQYKVEEKTNSQTIHLSGEGFGTSGSHTYTIKYRYHMGRDKYVGKDVLSFRLFDKVDRSLVDHINFSISFPNTKAEIHLFDGDKDISSLIKQKEGENTLLVSLDEYEIKDFITIYAEFPDNFFTSFTYNYNFICLGVCVGIILISLAGFSIWLLQYEKRHKRIKKTPHYPTDGLDPASIGYVGGENDLNRLTYALLANLILKGYVDAYRDGDKLIVKKGLARFDAKVMSTNERALFNTLFSSEKEVVVNKFNFQQLQNNVSEHIYEKLDKKFNKFENSKSVLYLAIINTILLGALLAVYALYNDMEPVFEFLYPLAFGIPVITTIIAIFVNRKFTYGYRLCTKVEHLREFYENAEQTDFDLLLFDDKDYYIKSIPYIYILRCNNPIINEFVKEKCSDLFDVVDGKLEQEIIK